MTYRDVVVEQQNLNLVNQIDKASAKFLYAVSRNKERNASVIKSLDVIKEPSKEMKEYWDALDKLNTKHAELDESGTVIYLTYKIGEQSQRGYKKIIGEGNPKSPYSKEFEKLKADYKEAIDKYEKSIEKYNEMLNDEIPEGELRRFMIDLEIVPDGLHPKAMDGCLSFIKPPSEDEAQAKSEKKKS